MQDLPYGNFSPSQYVQADICKFADFAEFVKYHRKAAQDLIKAEQHSRSASPHLNCLSSVTTSPHGLTVSQCAYTSHFLDVLSLFLDG